MAAFVERDAIQLAAGERQHVDLAHNDTNEILSAGQLATMIGGNLGRHGTKTIAGRDACWPEIIPRVMPAGMKRQSSDTDASDAS